MRITMLVVTVLALLPFWGSDAFAFEYAWLTDTEVRAFGDQINWGCIEPGFGTIRSNSAVCACGFVHIRIITADTICGDWDTIDPDPIEHAAEYPFPDSLLYLRSLGTYFQRDGSSWFVDIGGSAMRVHGYPTGSPIDTLENPEWEAVPIVGERMAIFFDGPLQIKGHLAGRLIVGCSHDIGIVDNLTYTDADQNGVIPGSSSNYLVLASEQNIIVRNTPWNGRENCNGGGGNNPNQNECGIIISAQLVALNGSFTFEDQNDPDSGYVCECVPDERGFLHLFGAIAQRRAGYVHRSNNSGTGYQKDYRFDSRILLQPDYVFFPPTEIPSTDTLDFGDVILGETAFDTAHVYRYFDSQFYTALATFPFVLAPQVPSFGNHFRFPLHFTPPTEGTFTGVLTVYMEGDPVWIVLRGRGVPGTAADEPLDLLPRELSLTVFPNPFNNVTGIRYALPAATPATMRLFDTTGRVVRTWSLSGPQTGTIQFHADELATGLYFLKLTHGANAVSQKLLLIK